MWKKLGGLLLVAAVALAWLTLFDRQSVPALHVLELDGRLGLPLYSLATLSGLVCLALAWRAEQKRRARVPARRGPLARQRTAALPLRPGQSWRDAIIQRARALPLEAGATLLIDQPANVPFSLVLEQMPPGRAKRAVSGMGVFLSSLPLPPRVRIVFRDCPQGGSPRHHQVAGALAAHIPRGSFRVVPHADQVDVLFVAPDPAWEVEW